MEYIILTICLLLIVGVGIYIILKHHTKVIKPPTNSENYLVSSKQNLVVKFEELSSSTKIDKSRLVEIKDKKLVQRMIDIVPNTSLALQNTTQAQNIKSISEQLYFVKLPAGETLVNSNTNGAFRAFSRGDKGRIQHNADLSKANEAVDKIATANLVNAGYNLASAIVGQHYMAEIDAKLETINTSISKISAFQENEYKSRVCALIAEIQELTKFQVEIIENEENRKQRLTSLHSLRHECMILLGQATATIQDIVKNESFEYKEYEERIVQTHYWYQYQNALSEILFQMSELMHALYLGTASKSHCHEICNMYYKQVYDCQSKLQLWHHTHEDKFAIDTGSIKRKRMGLEGIIFKLPAYLISEDLKYKSISESTAKMIESQKSDINSISQVNDIDLFQEDVDVIAKDGKLYYLPPN